MSQADAVCNIVVERKNRYQKSGISYALLYFFSQERVVETK